MREGLNRFFPGAAGSGSDETMELNCVDISPNPFQPRQNFSPENLDELAQSIKTYGLLQPILVRRHQGAYQLVAGERRLRACKLLGWQKIPAVIREVNDSAMAAMALIENLQRENLSYFEEAEGYQRLLDEFGLTQEVLAQRIGKSQSTIANKMRLLKLATSIQQKLLEAGLSERHARALLRLPDNESREKVLEKIIKLLFYKYDITHLKQKFSLTYYFLVLLAYIWDEVLMSCWMIIEERRKKLEPTNLSFEITESFSILFGKRWRLWSKSV